MVLIISQHKQGSLSLPSERADHPSAWEDVQNVGKKGALSAAGSLLSAGQGWGAHSRCAAPRMINLSLPRHDFKKLEWHRNVPVMITPTFIDIIFHFIGSIFCSFSILHN